MQSIARFGITVSVEDQDRAIEEHHLELGLSSIEALLQDDPIFSRIEAIPLFGCNGNYIVVMDDRQLYFVDHEMVSADGISVFNQDFEKPNWETIPVTRVNVKIHCLKVGTVGDAEIFFNDALGNVVPNPQVWQQA